jgi:hypothetical protein
MSGESGNCRPAPCRWRPASTCAARATCSPRTSTPPRSCWRRAMPTCRSATRNIKALYAELVVPVTKDLELQLAMRRDDYSVIGATTNPKVAFRYQPASWLLFRGSANKGFLAPSFGQLYTGALPQELPNGVIDPTGCARTRAMPASARSGRLITFGRQPNLKPETSKQGTLGFVVEPFKGFSASLDYWAINIKDRILNRTPQVVLANAALLGQTSSAMPTAPSTTSGRLDQRGRRQDPRRRPRPARRRQVRAAGSGAPTWTAPGPRASSSPSSKASRTRNTSAFYTRDLYLRWKHNATFSRQRGDWSAMLSNVRDGLQGPVAERRQGHAAGRLRSGRVELHHASACRAPTPACKTRRSPSASRTCSTAIRRSPRTTSTKSSAPAGIRAWPIRVAVRYTLDLKYKFF